MKQTKERILVLDGHTNQALACVRSLGDAGHKVFVASHQRFPLSVWSRHCRGVFLLTEQNVEAFESLREWARKKGITIVLPLTERSCVLCNADREKWKQADIIVGCGSNEILQTAFDKAATIQRAAAAGLRIPPTFYPESLDDGLAAVRQLGFPAVVKSRWSNAWDGKQFLPTLSPTYLDPDCRLDDILTSHKQGDCWPLVQGYVSGQGKGVFALCDHGRVIAWFAHERLRDTRPTGSSSSLRRSIPLDGRLRVPAERLLSELKWHGPAMVEFKDDGINPPCLMEINGRFWGSLQLAIDAGVDFPRLWVSLLRGESPKPVTRYQEGLAVRWLFGDVKRFLSILRGAPKGFPGKFPKVRHGFSELFGKQPPGTRMEMLRASDPWPGIGEWASGFRDLFARWENVSTSSGGSKSNGRNEVNGRNGSRRFAETGHHLGPSSSNESHSSSLVVREATAEEEARWDDLVMRFENYRVAHKLAWINSLESSVSGRPLYLVCEKEKEIVACLPGFLTSIGPLRLFGSPLQGWQTVSMGPAFDQKQTSTAELAAPVVKFLEKHYGVHHVEMISSSLDESAMKNLHFRAESLPTYRAPLFPHDPDRVFKKLKDSARRNVKRAIKLGLVVKFEEDESFVAEHYDQLKEVFARGGNTVPFRQKRALEFFRHMKAGGNLLAVSVYLPDNGANIATGMFTVEGKELLLWMWTHRTQYRWYRPTELMTWTVMKRAMEMGCETFDFMGRGDFKAKFGAELDESKHRWVWSRYVWLATARNMAGRGYKWQQAVRGNLARRTLLHELEEGQPHSASSVEVSRDIR